MFAKLNIELRISKLKDLIIIAFQYNVEETFTNELFINTTDDLKASIR